MPLCLCGSSPSNQQLLSAHLDVPLGYAEGICRRMSRGKGLQEVDEGEAGTRLLWKVYFALKYEGKRRNHRGTEAQRGATKGHEDAQREEVSA